MSATPPSTKELFTLLQKKSKDKCKFSLSCEEGHTKHIWQSLIKTEAHLKLFYELMKRTLDSLIEKRYSDFDAQTTTNCCHGIAIFVRRLILETMELDLEEIKAYFQNPLDNSIESVPGVFVDLISLYTLTFITEVAPSRGRICYPKKLKKLTPSGTDFCQHLVKKLQVNFSILITKKYSEFLKNIEQEMEICGAPIKMWGKYVGRQFLREDNRGKIYASSLFSMQVAIAQIIQSKSKIAFVNDVINDKENKRVNREVYLLQGNGVDKFISLDVNENADIKEPVIVFSGCSNTDRENSNNNSLSLKSWMLDFPSLVLAGETHYPQFPKVKDSDFDFSPILPEEPILQTILERHRKVEGVSAKNPSLLCFTHIFPASLKQVLDVLREINIQALPDTLIPSILR